MNLLLVDGSDDGSDQGINDPEAPADGTPGNDVATVTAKYPDPTIVGAAEMASKPINPPPLLELPPVKTPEAATSVAADDKPEVKPTESDNPPVTPITDAPPAPMDKTIEQPLPPTANVTAEDKPADKPTEPLPAMTDAAPVAKIPDPPSTSQAEDWTSGAATAGNLPAEPAPQGPAVEAATSDEKNHLMNTADGKSAPVVGGPVVESGNAAITGRAVPQDLFRSSLAGSG